MSSSDLLASMGTEWCIYSDDNFNFLRHQQLVCVCIIQDFLKNKTRYDDVICDVVVALSEREVQILGKVEETVEKTFQQY